MDKNSRIYVAGHRGMVGSAIVRRLKNDGYENLILRTHSELDLTNQAAVESLFATEKPDYVFMAAAKVGGIHSNNTYRGEFIYRNLMIQSNIIHQAYLRHVKKLIFLGSSCIYPKNAPQPIKEEYLLKGELEPTNEPYAVAKIAGIKLCQAYNDQYGTQFISAMPTNLYGPNDNYDLETSHVLPALIRKFHEAKLRQSPYVEMWGTGKPMREFLYVDDLADACLFLMERYNGNNIVNIGCGQDITISGLGNLIKEIVGFQGETRFDVAKPDGTFRKLLDISQLTTLGWSAKIDLRTGIKMAYANFLETPHV